MPAEDIEKFVEKAAIDGMLQHEIQATMGDKDKICVLAAAHGFSFTLEDLDSFVSNIELDDEDLDNVSGGISRLAGTNLLWSALNTRVRSRST